MKTLVISIMLVALYLLYRIAFPKRQDTERSEAVPPRIEPDGYETVVKSRYVLPKNGQSPPNAATPLFPESRDEKALTFAPENESRTAVVPSEKLDDVFGDEPNPEDLDIEPDDENENSDEPEMEEEDAEDLFGTIGWDKELAAGLNMDEMTEVVSAIDHPTDENAGLLYRVEKTDMFEKLVSGDEGKTARIQAVIDRHIQWLYPESANVDESNDDHHKDFDVMQFLS